MTAATLPERAPSWSVVERALADLPGRPFASGARGPDAYDCWGLVLEVRRRLGMALPPDFASGALDEAALRALCLAPAWPAAWTRLDAPRMGCVVIVCAVGHAGIHLAGRVLHARRRYGVVASSIGQWTACFGALECWEVARG
jgi:cell wall-associated NlpC family hydrolase